VAEALPENGDDPPVRGVWRHFGTDGVSRETSDEQRSLVRTQQNWTHYQK